jgi:hypothetical protein
MARRSWPPDAWVAARVVRRLVMRFESYSKRCISAAKRTMLVDGATGDGTPAGWLEAMSASKRCSSRWGVPAPGMAGLHLLHEKANAKMDPPAQPKEVSMDQKPTDQATGRATTGQAADQATNQAIKDDVLHATEHSQLSQEEIAKAIAHHNKHHPKDKTQMSGKSEAGKSPGGAKKGK